MIQRMFFSPHKWFDIINEPLQNQWPIEDSGQSVQISLHCALTPLFNKTTFFSNIATQQPLNSASTPPNYFGNLNSNVGSGQCTRCSVETHQFILTAAYTHRSVVTETAVKTKNKILLSQSHHSIQIYYSKLRLTCSIYVTTERKGDILFLVRILLAAALALALAWHFLVCMISHEPVGGF